MRLILEKEEIVRILSRRFETELDPETVIIRTEPNFEIELIGIPLLDEDVPAPPSRPEPPAYQSDMGEEEDDELYLQRSDKNIFYDTPPPGVDDDDPVNILRQSRKIADQLAHEHPQLARPRDTYQGDDE